MSPPRSFYPRDSENTEDHHRRPKKKENEKHRSKSAKIDLDDYSDDDDDFVELDRVPAPIPDTRKHRTSHMKSATKSVLTPKSTSRTLSKSRSATTARHTINSVPTHNLAATDPSATSITSPHPSSLSSMPKADTAPSFQPTTLVIVLLTVGATVLIIGLAILIKTCSKPKRRWYPTPSLPILQDDPFEPDGSPLFGGKERHETIQWTQYTQPSFDSEKTAFSTISDEKVLNCNDSYHDAHSTHSAKYEPTFPVPAIPQPSHPPPTRVPVRMSTISASVYPGSPGSLRRFSDIGIALTTPAPALTADGHPIITRSRSKSDSRRSKSHSMYSSSNLAYDGVDIASPVLQAVQSQPLLPPTTLMSTSLAGRTPTRSSYIQRSGYGRWSEGKSPNNAAIVDSSYQLARAGVERRDRDTRALTTALGLQTPILGSETPATIYPEDSLSVRSLMPVNKGHKKALPVTSPSSRFSVSLGGGADTSLALGSLMMMDYGPNDKSSADLAANMNGREGNRETEKQTWNGDRPPRVPSPPQFPSLAQMAMEYQNPDAYANYHSPTYSIYGMYDPNRRSKA